ncbi:DUF5309 domain-containing protein [Breoghania sp.]|uniref:DUF5309 domain-containing protein n=1 Tax=Breoghania sp. TaxID=2065378 RepID=UPI00262DF21F|nr:DUF5309 domain-containing protein [Breoghania sp.]MDJ0933732.1 DUF5309 domain-containing protein [Breoghania sp.]
MAKETGAFSVYGAVGNREDLINRIFDISPTDCPVTMAIGTSRATAIKHEWQTDVLATHTADNAHTSGEGYAYTEPAATVRPANYTQILRKTIKITGTQEAVDKAGRASELGYQASKRSKEMKRDLEASVTSNNPSVAGNDTTARKLGGLRAWLTSNTSIGATGSDGGFNTGTGIVAAATNGTQRALTKALLDGVIKSCFVNGAELRMLSVGPHNKQVFSGLLADTKVAQQRTNVSGDGQMTIYGGADVYVSDFGSLNVVANRFQPERNAYLVDPDYASVAALRNTRIERPAKTGDALNWVIIEEKTLRVDNEKAHGVVADLETS